jgi:hypothetical protein
MSCIEEGIQKVRKMTETNVVSNLDFALLKFYVPTSLFAYVSPILLAIILMWPHLTLVGFDGVGVGTFPRIFHKSTKQYKGKELALGVFKSPFPINIEDAKVSPLHVIFDLKNVLVGKDYFRINHLLPPPFNLI